MEKTQKDFFNRVQQELHEMGLDTRLSQDELDIVDDYETQQFSIVACIEYLTKRRNSRLAL